MPEIITIYGPAASGKSTITAALREKLPSYAYVDRPNIKRGLKSIGGREALRLSKDTTYYLINKLMADGYDIIAQEVDAKSMCKKIGDAIKNNDYRIYSFFIKCSIDEAVKRDKNRQKKPREELIREIHSNFAKPDEKDIVIDTEKISANEAVELILEEIKK